MSKNCQNFFKKCILLLSKPVCSDRKTDSAVPHSSSAPLHTRSSLKWTLRSPCTTCPSRLLLTFILFSMSDQLLITFEPILHMATVNMVLTTSGRHDRLSASFCILKYPNVHPKAGHLNHSYSLKAFNVDLVFRICKYIILYFMYKINLIYLNLNKFKI